MQGFNIIWCASLKARMISSHYVYLSTSTMNSPFRKCELHHCSILYCHGTCIIEFSTVTNPTVFKSSRVTKAKKSNECQTLYTKNCIHFSSLCVSSSIRRVDSTLHLMLHTMLQNGGFRGCFQWRSSRAMLIQLHKLVVHFKDHHFGI